MRFSTKRRKSPIRTWPGTDQDRSIVQFFRNTHVDFHRVPGKKWILNERVNQTSTTDKMKFKWQLNCHGTLLTSLRAIPVYICTSTPIDRERIFWTRPMSKLAISEGWTVPKLHVWAQFLAKWMVAFNPGLSQISKVFLSKNMHLEHTKKLFSLYSEI